MMEQREAEFGVAGWGGPRWQRCLVIGETPKRYRIQAIGETLLPSYRRLKDGEQYLIPKHAIRFIEKGKR